MKAFVIILMANFAVGICSPCPIWNSCEMCLQIDNCIFVKTRTTYQCIPENNIHAVVAVRSYRKLEMCPKLPAFAPNPIPSSRSINHDYDYTKELYIQVQDLWTTTQFGSISVPSSTSNFLLYSGNRVSTSLHVYSTIPVRYEVLRSSSENHYYSHTNEASPPGLPETGKEFSVHLDRGKEIQSVALEGSEGTSILTMSDVYTEAYPIHLTYAGEYEHFGNGIQSQQIGHEKINPTKDAMNLSVSAANIKECESATMSTELFTDLIPPQPWNCTQTCTHETLKRRLERSLCRTKDLMARYAKSGNMQITLGFWDSHNPSTNNKMYCQYLRYIRRTCA